ncbi:MAG TPA: hypothetical protein VGB15_01440 [Longimicrobium sp.]|jgi:hypothetical protein
MQKLRLDLDRLTVDSFATLARTETPRGTVRGRDDTFYCPTPDCTVSCGFTELNTCTGGGAVSNSGCAENTQYCAFDSVRICDEHAVNRTEAC